MGFSLVTIMATVLPVLATAGLAALIVVAIAALLGGPGRRESPVARRFAKRMVQQRQLELPFQPQMARNNQLVFRR